MVSEDRAQTRRERVWREATRLLLLFATVWPAVAPAPTQAAQARPERQPPVVQARPGGPSSGQHTDQTIDAAKGTRLVLSNHAGEVVIRSWDRDQVRVRAQHSDRVVPDIRAADGTLRIHARSAGQSSLAHWAAPIDYQITVPRWMPVNLSGSYLDASIEGTAAEVTVETVHGSVRVTGGSGTVSVRSVEGRITIEQATGRIRATTVDEDIRVTGVSGDMQAETVDGDIWIDDARMATLDASTVDGNITFNGALQPGGAYRLMTHDGDIRVGLGATPDVTVFVRSFQGAFGADFPVQLPEGQDPRRGSKRFNFTLGSGSARLELQTFNGDILLARRTVNPGKARLQKQLPLPPLPPPVSPVPLAAPAPTVIGPTSPPEVPAPPEHVPESAPRPPATPLPPPPPAAPVSPAPATPPRPPGRCCALAPLTAVPASGSSPTLNFAPIAPLAMPGR